MGVYCMWANRTRREYILPSDPRLCDNLKWPTGRSVDVLFALIRWGDWLDDVVTVIDDRGDEWHDVLEQWRNALDVPQNEEAVAKAMRYFAHES